MQRKHKGYLSKSAKCKAKPKGNAEDLKGEYKANCKVNANVCRKIQCKIQQDDVKSGFTNFEKEGSLFCSLLNLI